MKKTRLSMILCIIALVVPTVATAAVTHRVKKSETLPNIATKYNVAVKELIVANNLVGGTIKPGDLLVIPAQEKPRTHKVMKGETLYSIARKNGISVTLLKKLNELDGNHVKPGQVLVVKKDRSGSSGQQVVAAKSSRLKDLFSEQEYEKTLAELTDSMEPAGAADVDLAETVEMNVQKIQELKKSAFSFLGTRYRFGGETRRGIDCSSFVQQVFRDLNVDLPRTAREQYKVGDEVPPDNLQKGDLVFFRTYARFPSHVGIYLGGNKMIHASSASKRVVISSIDTPYYRSRYIGAKRIAKVNPEFARFDDLVTEVPEEAGPELQENAEILSLIPTELEPAD